MSSSVKNFNIVVDRTLRVGQLSELARNGAITRTAHLGNLHSADLILLSLGVPLRLVDKNCSVVDSLHQPEARIIDGKLELLSSQQRVLAPYLHDSQENSLAHMHLSATRASVAGCRASTYSIDYLMEIDRILPLLEVMACLAPEMFNRATTESGEVLQQTGVDDRFAYYGSGMETIRCSRAIMAERAVGYFQTVVESLASGKPATGAGHLLLRLEADIILHGVIDTQAESTLGLRRFYQCGGMAMQRYIADPRLNKSSLIDRLYGSLRQRIGDLPAIEMVLLPISHLRFGYLESATEALHYSIRQIELTLREVKKEKAREMQSATTYTARAEIIDRYQRLYRDLKSSRKGFIEQLLDSKFHPFYPLGCAQRMTQHDLAAADAKLRIPVEVMEMPLQSLTTRLKQLLKEFPARLAPLIN